MIKLYGKPIRVNKASQDKNSQEVGANLFIGNLDPDVDEKVWLTTSLAALCACRVAHAVFIVFIQAVLLAIGWKQYTGCSACYFNAFPVCLRRCM